MWAKRDSSDSVLLSIGGKIQPPPGGGAQMRYYRLYFFDPHSGHIDHFREFESEEDSAALAIAERWGVGQVMELWNRERRLKRWDSLPSHAD